MQLQPPRLASTLPSKYCIPRSEADKAVGATMDRTCNSGAIPVLNQAYVQGEGGIKYGHSLPLTCIVAMCCPVSWKAPSPTMPRDFLTYLSRPAARFLAATAILGHWIGQNSSTHGRIYQTWPNSMSRHHHSVGFESTVTVPRLIECSIRSFGR